MSFACGIHGWRHAQSPCPLCNENIQSELDALKKENAELVAERDWFKQKSVEQYESGCVRAMERELLKIKDLEAALACAMDALVLIEMPKRSDGTYNRSREACEAMARAALSTPAIARFRRVQDARSRVIEAAKELDAAIKNGPKCAEAAEYWTVAESIASEKLQNALADLESAEQEA